MNLLFANLFSGPGGAALYQVLHALSGLLVIAAWILLVGAVLNLFLGYRYSRIASLINVFTVCGFTGGVLGVLLFKGAGAGFFLGLLLVGGGAAFLSWRFPIVGTFLDGFFWGFFLLGFLLIFGGNRISALIFGIVGGLALGVVSIFIDRRFFLVKTAVQGGSVCGILIGLLFWHLLAGLFMAIGLSAAGVVIQMLLMRVLPPLEEKEEPKGKKGKKKHKKAKAEEPSPEPLPKVGNPDLFVEDILRELPYVFSEDVMLQMKSLPEFYPDGSWICACGQRSSAEQCPRCGLEKEDAELKLNYRYLKEHRSTRLNVEKRLGGTMPVVGRVSDKGEESMDATEQQKEEANREPGTGENPETLPGDAAAQEAGNMEEPLRSEETLKAEDVSEAKAPAKPEEALKSDEAAAAAEAPKSEEAPRPEETGAAAVAPKSEETEEGKPSKTPESDKKEEAGSAGETAEEEADAVLAAAKGAGATSRKSRRKKKADRGKNKEMKKAAQQEKAEKEVEGKAEPSGKDAEKKEEEKPEESAGEKPKEGKEEENKESSGGKDKKKKEKPPRAEKKPLTLAEFTDRYKVLLIIAAVVLLLGAVGGLLYLNRSAIESTRLNAKAAATEDAKERSELYTDAIELKENAESWIGLLKLAVEENNRKLALLCIDHLEEFYPNNGKYKSLKKEYAPEKPVSSLSDGTYNTWQDLALSSSKDATIYFTINGGEPYQYQSSVSMNRNGDYLIRAYAENELGFKSDEAEFHYVFEAMMPQAVVFDHQSGEYFTNQTVSLSQPDGLTIFYTTDGSVPDSTSKVYAGPIVVGRGFTRIAAVCYSGEGVSSEVAVCEIGVHGEIRGNAIRFSESGYTCDYFASDKGLCRYDTAGNLIGVIDATQARGLRFHNGILYYFADGALKRYIEETGQIETLASAEADMCAVADGRIYFAEVGGPLLSVAMDGSGMEDHGGEMTNLDFHEGILYLAEPNRVSRLLSDGSFEQIFTREVPKKESGEEGEEGEEGEGEGEEEKAEEEENGEEENGEEAEMMPIRSILADTEGIYFTSDGLSIYQNGQIGTLVEGISEVERKEPKKGKAGSGKEHLRYPEKLSTFAGHFCFRYCDEEITYGIDPETGEETDVETQRKGSVYTYDLENGEFRSIAGFDFYPVSDGYFTYSTEQENFVKLDFESAMQSSSEGEEATEENEDET